MVSTLKDLSEATGRTDVQFTVFAPNHEAMMNVPERDLNEINAMTQTGRALKQETVLYHFIQAFPDDGKLPHRLASDLGNTTLQSDAANSPNLFFRQLWRSRTMVQFVNGAEILDTVNATNGVVHIIDHFLHKIALKDSAYSFIANNQDHKYIELRTSKFLEILDASQHLTGSPYQQLNSDGTFVTVFVPTDRALTDLTTERMGKLKSNKEQLVKLLRRHVISSQSSAENGGVRAVYHASLLEEARQQELWSTGRLAEIPALEGALRPISVNDELYVTNTCGRVKVLMKGQVNIYSSRRPAGVPVFANFTVNNGVVHLVDGLLGYIYNDAYTMIREDERVSAMKQHIERAPDRWANRLRLPVGQMLRADQRVTVFVPVNEAFYSVENAEDMEHFSRNITYVQEVLNSHIIRGQYSLTDLKDVSSLPTYETGQEARFRWQGDDLHVMVGHIEARVVVPDVCVENGILHFVDAVLGVPYLTVFEFINQDYSLRNLYKYIRKAGIEVTLKNVKLPVTFFAPNQEAFDQMQEMRIGRELLGEGADNENKLQKVLLAHAVQGYFYTDDMQSDEHRFPGSQLVLIKEGQDYFVELRGDYRTVMARVLRSNLRMTNGVLYVIDRVLFEDSQEAYQALAVSSTVSLHTASSTCFIFLLVIWSIIANMMCNNSR